MPDRRPDPDALLARVEADERQSRRGRLRIFFGYAAGVGKTYAMLGAARRTRATGKDVVVGYVEPHDRPETMALVEGLEILPPLSTHHRGVTLREVDVAAVTARRPGVVLVDELAHTNAPGSLHEKRWQDVADLLAAGIDVWTTLNVQHLESLNDVIGQITGIVVRETVPDHVFDAADEVELVDITPDELLQRIREGKVYLPEQAARALQRFFQRPNLTALREMSLRQTARRVQTDVDAARRGRAAEEPWATTQRLLVCVGPGPTTPRVIRTAKRLAMALGAEWTAVAVESPGGATDAERRLVTEHFRLAEHLGADTVALSGHSFADTVVACARERNITTILIGTPRVPWWRRALVGTPVEELLARGRGIDVLVVHGDDRPPSSRPDDTPRQRPAIGSSVRAALPPIAIAAAVAAVLRWFPRTDSEANTVMLFLAGIVWAAARGGFGTALAASLLAVLLFDFFFVPPHFTLAVADFEYVGVFAMLLVVGVTIGTLASRLREQVATSRRQEHRTALLYALSRQLSGTSGPGPLAEVIGRTLGELVGGEVAVWLRGDGGNAEIVAGSATAIAADPLAPAAVDWVIGHDGLAGAGTDTLPAARALFVPLPGAAGVIGALGVGATDLTRLGDPEERRLLEACAAQLGVALDRDRAARRA
ncbi:MAG: sensor histidine kinase KdpD [Planctomycetia bacterium]|nr:sensor histidine kinase KdpD [Planctomycetia bacterium]